MNLLVYWLEEIVIGLNLCPFAKIPYQNGLVRLVENESTSESDQLSIFLDELEHLQQTPGAQLSTTLIAFVNDQSDFADFNDFVGLCEDIMVESGLEEHFQLVAFHPEFILEGLESADHPQYRSNWVGRSPYPTIHLLRNADIEMALAGYSDIIGIPARNEEKLQALSDQELNKIFHYLK